jgi:hypothetical protein
MRRGPDARLQAITAVVAVIATAAAAGTGSAFASGQTKPPHISGSKYCETVYKADDYTLYGYVKGVGCATEKSFVAKCQASTGLQGWKLTSSNEYAFLLRKGSGTLDLQIAGGSPRCITAALS